MSFTERITWTSLVVLPVVALTYFTVVLTRLADAPVDEVSWIVPMIWAIGTVIVGMIAGAIAQAIAATIASGGEEPDTEGDVRDKEIDRIGEYAARHVTSLGCMAVIVLAMLRADHFWIANGVFLAGLVGGVVSGIVKIRAYRRGF